MRRSWPKRRGTTATSNSRAWLPAEILGLADRGKIRVGSVADLVAFDSATFRDHATFDDPTRYAAGVLHLFINGIVVVVGGEPKPALPGRAIRLGKR